MHFDEMLGRRLQLVVDMIIIIVTVAVTGQDVLVLLAC